MAAKLASLYARGVITLDELLLKSIFEAAYDTPPLEPSEWIAALPDDAVAALREICLRPPSSPDEAPYIGGVCGGGAMADPDHWRRVTSREWFDGVWRWHRYFEALSRAETGPDPSDPPAE